MAQGLGIDFPTAIVMVAIIIGVVVIAIFQIREGRKKDKRPNPLIQSLLITFFIVIIFVFFYFLEITEWNILDHPGWIILIFIGMFSLAWIQLRLLQEKKYEELEEIAKAFLARQVYLQPQDFRYVPNPIYRRIKRGETKIAQFIWQVKTIEGIKKMSVGIDVFTGDIIEHVFPLGLKDIEKIKAELLSTPADIRRQPATESPVTEKVDEQTTPEK